MPDAARATLSALSPPRPSKPFMGVIDAVVVDRPADYLFDGAVTTEEAAAAWTWMGRDLAPDLIGVLYMGESADPRLLDLKLPEVLGRARQALENANASGEAERRLSAQLGGEAIRRRLPTVLNALRCRGLLEKAKGFGRATNSMTDDAQLQAALETMPLNDPPVAALLFQAALGQVSAPARLVLAAVRLAGDETETALQRAGFAPLVDAILAHAQNQIPVLGQSGTFADMDLACRAIDRFHRLMRAISAYLELNRGGRWAGIMGGLIRAICGRIEPKLRFVAPDLNKALRPRDGLDRLDGDQMLMALNGMYLLSAVRDARDSLAVNATFEQVWAQTGQALELHLDRLLEQFRQNPASGALAARLEGALKLSELRFGLEYADGLRRVRDMAGRRLAAG